MKPADAMRLDPDDGRIGSFIAGAADSTYCHHPAWPGVIEDALGQESWHMATTDATGNVTALMPVSHIRSRLLGDRLVSLPFLNAGGPLGCESGKATLIRTALQAARDRSCPAEIRTRTPPPGGFTPTVRRITVVKELPETSEEAWKTGLRAKVRSQIRRPQKEGLVFRSGPKELDGFYRVFAQNMRDLGTPVLSPRFFELIRERMAEAAVFAVVYREGEPVAGGCGFVWKSTFEITWASSLRAHSRVAPNMLLYWGLMERMIEDRGVRLFDFGRCRPQSNTHRFKTQWGTEDLPLPWISVSRSGAAEEAHDNTALHLASRVWTRMPLAVTNRLGPRLARLMP